MGRIGVQTWGYRILANLGELKYNAKNVRLNYERQYIGKLKPELNKPTRKTWISKKCNQVPFILSAERKIDSINKNSRKCTKLPQRSLSLTMYRVQELLQGYTTKNKEPKFGGSLEVK